MNDDTRVQQLEQDAQRLGACLTAMLENITDAFLMLDRDWRITFINREAERLLQCQRERVQGVSLWEVFPEAVDGPYYHAYHQAVASGQVAWFEEYYAPLDLWTEVRAHPSAYGLAIYFLDISLRKAQEAALHRLAFHDHLTGLPNRQLLAERIADALRRQQRSAQTSALLFIDLDNFKSVNDVHGHEKGDALLRLAAERLLQLVCVDDTVARFGGDEFVILQQGLDADGRAAAAQVDALAAKILLAFAAPFDTGAAQHYVSPSLGLALLDRSVDSIEQVIRRADMAMYQSKTAGRNMASWFDPAIEQRAAARAALEADLRHALVENQFELHYQPQCDMGGRMTGVEALLRWRHPQRGLVPPVEFIPASEETGLIVPLGHWVLDTACRLLAQWAQSPRTAHLQMAVNVSAQQFQRPDFVAQTLALLAAAGVPPQRLKLELTESLLLADVEGTVAKMERLRDAGVRCALDDFGTGYSSLSYLHRLPLVELKIDRSFIWGIAQDSAKDTANAGQGGAIVHAVAALGKALCLDVLAEGVETEAQRAFIVAAGCQGFQGYLYARPMPLPQLQQFIDSAQPG
ncbi:MAG: EAL domain-containing protein [Burkholderiaceae bacterium]|nr:EAL domain-containing protein [Burkholderiaceae bacterium]